MFSWMATIPGNILGAMDRQQSQSDDDKNNEIECGPLNGLLINDSASPTLVLKLQPPCEWK